MTQTATVPVTKAAAASSRPFQTHPGDHRFFSAIAIVTALTVDAVALRNVGDINI